MNPVKCKVKLFTEDKITYMVEYLPEDFTPLNKEK